jgi:hypothetical protein
MYWHCSIPNCLHKKLTSELLKSDFDHLSYIIYITNIWLTHQFSIFRCGTIQQMFLSCREHDTPNAYPLWSTGRHWTTVCGFEPWAPGNLHQYTSLNKNNFDQWTRLFHPPFWRYLRIIHLNLTEGLIINSYPLAYIFLANMLNWDRSEFTPQKFGYWACFYYLIDN